MTGQKVESDIGSMFGLHGRNYVVTGGAQGIGFAITKAIAKLGGNVVAMDIKDQPRAEFYELSKQFGVLVEFVQADVTKQDSLKSAFEQAVNVLGSVDGCVTCAGIALDKKFEEHTWEDVQNILNINASPWLSHSLARDYNSELCLTTASRFLALFSQRNLQLSK